MCVSSVHDGIYKCIRGSTFRESVSLNRRRAALKNVVLLEFQSQESTNDVSRFAFPRPFGGWLGCANWWAKRSVGRKCMPYQPRAVNVVWDGQFQWEPRIVWLLFSLRANVISLGWRMLLSSRVLLVGVLKYSSCLNGSHGIIHTLFSQYRYKFVINECGIFIYAWLYRYSLTLNSENSYSISTHSLYIHGS